MCEVSYYVITCRYTYFSHLSLLILLELETEAIVRVGHLATGTHGRQTLLKVVF